MKQRILSTVLCLALLAGVLSVAGITATAENTVTAITASSNADKVIAAGNNILTDAACSDTTLTPAVKPGVYNGVVDDNESDVSVDTSEEDNGDESEVNSDIPTEDNQDGEDTDKPKQDTSDEDNVGEEDATTSDESAESDTDAPEEDAGDTESEEDDTSDEDTTGTESKDDDKPSKKPVQIVTTETYFPWWGFLLIGLGVVAVAAVIIILAIRKKKAKET